MQRNRVDLPPNRLPVSNRAEFSGFVSIRPVRQIREGEAPAEPHEQSDLCLNRLGGSLALPVVLAICAVSLLAGCKNEEPDASSTDGVAVAAPKSHPSSPDDASSTETDRVDGDAASDADAASDGQAAGDTADGVTDRVPDAPAKKILEDSHEIVKRFDDETVQYRWFVRLYVDFDRSKSWDRQTPGSWVRHGTFEEYYPGGKQLLETGRYVVGNRDGVWSYWHANGQKAKEGAYKSGKLNGDWRIFREDGTLQRTGSYVAHQKHGTWRHFAADGETPVREERYAAGLPHGRWTRWRPSGEKVEESEFSEGKRHGARRTWHQGGTMASEEHFRFGKRHGAARRWDPDGTLTSSVKYDEGRRVQSAPAG